MSNEPTDKDGLQETLSALSEHDPETAAEALQEHAPDVWQQAYDAGHGAATRKLRPEIKELQVRLDHAQDELEDQASLEEAIQEVRQEAAEEVRSERLATFRTKAAKRIPEVEAGVTDPDLVPLLLDGIDLSERVRFGEDNAIEAVIGRDGEPLSGDDPVEAFARDFYAGLPDSVKLDPRPGSTGLGELGHGAPKGSEVQKQKELEQYR